MSQSGDDLQVNGVTNSLRLDLWAERPLWVISGRHMTSPAPVRFTSNNWRWAAPKSAPAYGYTLVVANLDEQWSRRW